MQNLIIVPSRHSLYREYSENVMEKLRDLTPLVEQISIDEAFLDISDIRQPPQRLALDLQTAIRTEQNLPSSIGIASNKLVAKIATEVGKKSNKNKNAPPFGLTIVPAGEEAKFLAPLPADMLWGVGPKTSARLTELGIHTIGDIANWPEKELIHSSAKTDATSGSTPTASTTAPSPPNRRRNPSARKPPSTWISATRRHSKRHYANRHAMWHVNFAKATLQEKPSN
jgi:nucleotidyltransferase/DNA polymerase involved in DNA repair